MQSVVERFAGIAAAYPGATALRAGAVVLTYRDLDARADRLARCLRAAGVGVEDRVAVRLDRSADLVVALLAILKAGAAFVALDPRDPPDRTGALVRDANATVLVTDDTAARSDGGVVVMTPADEQDDLDTAPLPEVSGDNLAYVAYTSGSTGRPKGVCVPHRAVHRLVVDSNVVDLRPGDVVLQYAPVAFDASTLEMWGPLLNGATLEIAPPGELTPAELVALMRRAGVTVAWLTAGLFHHVVDHGLDDLPRLRRLLAGGDVLSVRHVRRAWAALPDAVVVNGYGPTENTTFTCCHEVLDEPSGASVPIGRPVTGTRVHVLDADLRPVTGAQVGVLYAAGLGLARGYLGKPGLTATHFLADPYAEQPGALMYDTGDRVRRLPDGALEFVGRADDQVKVQGFRVEPAEAEAALGDHPEVRAAAVVARHDDAGGHRLTAFYEAAVPVPAAELRSHLAARVPRYLVPSAFTWLEALPLTANGKVDRRDLARRRSRSRPDLAEEYRAPETPVEKWLVSVWEVHLGIDRIGIDDDFFELGGHSLLATMITAEITAEFDMFVGARRFYANPTIAELGETIGELSGDEPATPARAEAVGP